MSDKKSVKTRQVVTAHPSSLKHSNSNNAQSTSFWIKLKRNWSIAVAALLSAVWVSFCVYLGKISDLDILQLPLIELATFLSAVSLPLIMIWIVCLVVMRINPVEENYRSLEAGLDQLLNPVEITQSRIVKIIENLKGEIDKIEAAGDLATNRFAKLEENFKIQISELFKATVDADEKSVGIKNSLASERDAITQLATEIENRSDKITEQFREFREDARKTSDETKKHSDFINNEMSLQNKTLESRSKQIEETLEILGTRLAKISDDVSDQTNHSYHHLSEIVDGFDERRAVLNNFMTSLMDEVSAICEKLETQANTINDLSGKSSKTSDKITKSIKKQAQELSKIADKTIKDLDASGDAIEAQTKSMGTSIEDATEASKINIAKASDYFTEAANDLNRVSSDLEKNIKHNFDEITDTITDKATSLGEDISIQFENIEADLERGNENITDIMGTNIDRLSALIADNKLETENLLGDVLSSIEGQSEKIEKSLSDTRINMIDRTTLIQDEHQSLENYAKSFQDKMIATEHEIKSQHQNMLNCISAIEDGLGISIDKIKKHSTNLGTHGQKVIESIISQTTELTHQIADIQNRSKNSIVEIQNASLQASDHILGREKETSEIIEEWLTTANNVGVEHNESMKKIASMMSELSHLEASTEKTLLGSEENIKRIASELLRSTDSIQIASNTAVEAVEETNQALERNAERYQQMINAIQLSSHSLAANANAMEKKLKSINSDNFSHISAQIMEKLQSQAIDISSYLEGDVPKDLWDNYLSGDKNLFIRKIKKYIGKKTVEQIRSHYIDSTEFRKNVDSFLQIFEELLATFNESTETVYSETLITSDIGKVYFALAEATGRLKI
tara:strand:- start:43984 stop:46557 length:2574 start_codon:yes stop_codon:yes gene_type:complete